MTELVERRTQATSATWRDDLPVAATAAGAAVLVWLAARLAGVDLEVHAAGGTQAVGVVSVVVSALVAALGGGAMLRVLTRRSVHGRRWWTVAALGVLVISLLGPLSAVTVADGVVLAAMHLVVGGVVVVGLRRRALA